MPGAHFRHRAAARYHDDDDDDVNDIDPDVHEVDSGVNGGAKLRRRRRRHLGCGSILPPPSQYQSRRILVVSAAIIIFTLVLSFSLHSGGKEFWQGATITISPIASNATYYDKGTTLEYDDDDNEGCTFRSYPSSRLYGLSSTASQQQQQQQQQPDFLIRATYIRGKWPIILNPIERDDEPWQTHPSKICIDTTSWEKTSTTTKKKNETGITSIMPRRRPFTDGQNPSVVSLASEPYDYPAATAAFPRLNHRHLHPLLASISTSKRKDASIASSLSLDELFLGAIAFGSGQCRFGLGEENEEEETKKTKEEEEDKGPPGGKRAVIYVLAPPTDFGNCSTHYSIGKEYLGLLRNQEKKQQHSHHHSVAPSSSFFRTLAQSTLFLERDAKYGTSRNRAISSLWLEETMVYARMQLEFDDPRLFFHHGRIWILYRNGPLFGYDAQVHNPVHFDQPWIIDDGTSSNKDEGKIFTAYVKASETVIIRGGRNIALISEEAIIGTGDGKVRWMPIPKLKALTWVDPVTVVEDIDLRGIDKRLSLIDGAEDNIEEADVDIENNGGVERKNGRRALSEQQRATATKSNIHGTNGYMIPLASTGELLGIAHFHRPENRRPSQYALHGHHYTHSFFTIARGNSGTTTTHGGDNSTINGTGQRYKLKRLSNEFVFRTNSIPEGMTQPPANDGDIIQFASGLDLLGSDMDGRVVISYGINDCEGAVLTLSMQIVQQMLIEVKPGQEVVDLMMEIDNN